MYSSPLHLEDIPLDEAFERWISELDFSQKGGPKRTEEVPVEASPGRVTARPVVARISSPHYYAAAIDGLAVRTTQTFGATSETPVRVKVGSEAIFVDTGSAMPEGFDAVIPMTELHFNSAEELEIRSPAAPWQNVRPTGEDVAADEIILPAAHRIQALEVGAMLAGGVTRVAVRERPSIAIIPVGSTLVRAGSPVAVGWSIECNSQILHALTEEWGGRAVVLDIVPERKDDVTRAVQQASAQFDVVVMVAGVSHGTALLASVVQDLGELMLYGISVKPGRSVCLGFVNGTPVLGLPGYAVSAFVTFDIFARPVIAKLLGSEPQARVSVSATLAREIHSPAGVTEFLRVNLGRVAGRMVALPISRGAAILMSLVRADGLLRVAPEVEVLPAGTRVEIELLNPSSCFDHNLLAIGTHDIVFDLLRNELMRRFPKVRFHSSNAGSLTGLRALEQGYAHVAGMHLFDETTGEYNLPFLEGEPLVLINLFQRHLGLIVAHDNPLGIKSFDDLKRPDVTFVNRQRGSGTRQLIDYHLRKHGIETAQVRGYERETYTHMSVASTIASGAADVGIGLPAVAKALRLDFIPAVPERFDLAFPRRLVTTPLVAALLSVVGSEQFKREIETLHGYDTSLTGTVVWDGEKKRV
ncbi:MAG: molybdopterin biosynthesis protein [Candidatus Xenobia bacterium]